MLSDYQRNTKKFCAIHHDNIFSFSKPGGIYTQNTYKIPQNALVKRRQHVMLSFLWWFPKLKITSTKRQQPHIHYTKKFFIKDFFSKCDQIRRKLRIFCAVIFLLVWGRSEYYQDNMYKNLKENKKFWRVTEKHPKSYYWGNIKNICANLFENRLISSEEIEEHTLKWVPK